MNFNKRKLFFRLTAHSRIERNVVIFLAFLSATILFMQGLRAASDSDNDLINAFVEAKGYSSYISFDASNIKQFWPDKSVLAKDNLILISLMDSPNHRQSVPLIIQLANVDTNHKCKIDIITDTPDISFMIENRGKEVLSESMPGDDFILHHTSSAEFYLKDTDDYSFTVSLKSETATVAKINRILISFTNAENNRDTASPHIYTILKKDVNVNSKESDVIDSKTISLKGQSCSIVSKKYFFVAHRIFSSSVKINNIGDVPVRLRVGYGCYTMDKKRIDARNYPYKEATEILKVVSGRQGSNTITVDKAFKWSKNCNIALNAKDDLSDIPNMSLLNRTITNVEEADNGLSVITLNGELNQLLEKDSIIRITNAPSDTFLYTNNVILQPGEEKVLSSRIQKDEGSLSFAPASIPQGVFFIAPVVVSHSLDSSKEHYITVSDYALSY